MFAAALKVVLCAAQLKLATVGFTQVGMTDAEASFYADHLSTQMRLVDEQNIRVTTPADMAALLGIEKQKQLLGCADESSSCMAELAGALGADGFVMGQIARVGQSFQLNVKILAPEGTKTLFLHSSKLLQSQEEIIEELNGIAVRAVARLRDQLPAAAGETAPGVTGSGVEARPRSKLKLIPAAVGGVALVVGAIALGQAGANYARLSNVNGWANLSVDQARESLVDGKQGLGIGLSLAIAGAVLIAASLLWYLLT